MFRLQSNIRKDVIKRDPTTPIHRHTVHQGLHRRWGLQPLPRLFPDPRRNRRMEHDERRTASHRYSRTAWTPRPG